MRVGKHLLLVLLFAAQICFAGELNTGVRFRSYGVAPEQRTEIVVPAGKAPLKVNDFFALSFKLRILPEREHFGYVSRFILNSSQSLDLLLINPVGGLPYIGVIFEGKEQAAIPVSDFHSFRTFVVDYESASLTIRTLEDEFSCSIPLGRKISSLRAHFGACSSKNFSSSDCAPMIIKDIEVSRHPSKVDWHWPLDYVNNNHLLSDKYGRAKCVVNNADWEILEHARWQKLDSLSFSCKTFPVLDPASQSIWYVGSDFVSEYSLARESYREYPVSREVQVGRLTNTFVAVPGGILYYDITDGIARRFSRESADWDGPILRRVHSPFLKGNVVFDASSESLIHLFGYGFHKYLNDIWTFNPQTGELVNHNSDSISPRYMAGVGRDGNRLVVFGGKGNASGRQELGTTTYSDLYSINLEDFSVEQLRASLPTDSELSSPSLLMRDDSFLALFYDPSILKTCFQLKRVSLTDGSVKPLADAVPYSFIDTDSYLDIMEDKENEVLYAVSVSKGAMGYKSVIWKLSLPILPLSQIVAGNSPWPVILIVLAILVLGCAVFLFIRFRKPAPLDAKEEVFINEDKPVIETKEDTLAPGLYLLGGFKAVDKNGVDITKSFTPVMKQLLSLIILYSESKNGVSNEEMQEALWSDKSKDSFFNNRSVNVRKIRLALEQIGDMNVASNDTFWYYVEGSENSCDYLSAMKLLREPATDNPSVAQIEQILKIAVRGELLSYIQPECFDQFKGDYSDLMIAHLTKFRDSETAASNLVLRKRICDAILVFDAIDESTVAIKCSCLMSLKRAGLARTVFDNFTKEYQRLMGEEYSSSFTDFLKNQK